MDTNIEETPALFNLMTWLEKNKKQVMIGLIVIAAVCLVVAYSNSSKRGKEQKAAQELSRVLLTPLLNRTSQAESSRSAPANAGFSTENEAPLRFPWLSWQTRELDQASKQPSPYGAIPLLGKEIDQKV